jgi:hypothetical protein
MSPHCSAIFLQHSRSADVIAAAGNTQAATGSAASVSARAETPTLTNHLTINSLSATNRKTQQPATNRKTQQPGKGFSFPPSRDRQKRPRIERNASAAPSFSLVLEFECSRGHQLWKCWEAIYNDDAQLEDMHRPMSESSSSESLPFVAVRRSWPSGIATMRCRR